MQVLACSPGVLLLGSNSPGRMLTVDMVSEAAAQSGLAPNAILIKNLGGGDPNIALQPDHYFYPASMIKTPLAVVAFTLVQAGQLHLDDRFETTQANMTANDKESPFVPGYRGTLREIIEQMITHSDNVATNMLFDILNRHRATDIVQNTYGLRNTAFHRKLSGSEPLIKDPEWDGVHRNAHSAGDAARLFELIEGEGVPFWQELRAILGRQQFNEKLPIGLLPTDKFYHKTGDTDEVTHDGGILETADGKTYVIVVYTGLESSDANNARFGPFMKTIRPYL